MSTTKIEWTKNADGTAGKTWNPIRARLPEAITLQQIGGAKKLEIGRWGYHCEHVSPGCVNCYAEAMNKRTLPAWGTGLAFNVPNRSRVEIFLDEKELVKPLSWKRPRKIFPCSMTDLFAEFVPDEMIDRMLAVMALCPQHVFQVLTKRAERMREYFSAGHRNTTIAAASRRYSDSRSVPFVIPSERIFDRRSVARCEPWSIHAWPLPNVHLGVSVEDQPNADKRIRELLATPAAVRWVSYEPALGPINFEPYLRGEYRGNRIPRLDWGVYGGESGRGARPNDIAWARSFIRQFHAVRLPAFVKQMGSFCVGNPEDWCGRRIVGPVATGNGLEERMRIVLKDRKGGDPLEWPIDLRVREMPEVPR